MEGGRRAVTGKATERSEEQRRAACEWLRGRTVVDMTAVEAGGVKRQRGTALAAAESMRRAVQLSALQAAVGWRKLRLRASLICVAAATRLLTVAVEQALWTTDSGSEDGSE